MSYRVSTQVYSGPFDLLLQLVTRQKVDIGAISISEVAEQYLAEVERIEALDLDVASDFLLVAATLLDIKAASLVPQEAPRNTDEDDEDDEDLEELSALDGDALREVLIQRLIAYKQFKGAAAALGMEYTLPDITQSVVITRMAGRTPVPERESVASFASHGATMVVFLSTGMLKKLSEELMKGGYQADTPAALCKS